MHEFDIPAFPHETESFEYSYPKVLSESQEMELAAELMEVNSEQELEQFLGDLIKYCRWPARLWAGPLEAQQGHRSEANSLPQREACSALSWRPASKSSKRRRLL